MNLASFWKTGGSDNQIRSLGRRYVSDSGADVCSRQVTPPLSMRLIDSR
jgi:hypothetical protein